MNASANPPGIGKRNSVEQEKQTLRLLHMRSPLATSLGLLRPVADQRSGQICNMVLRQHMVPGIQWCPMISFGMTGNSLCQIYNIYIYNFPEYKTTPQAFGSVASHPILTVAARYTDLHNTLIYIDLYRFTLIYTACFVVVQRLSDSRIFKPFGQLVGFVPGCSWGLGRVELGPTVAKSGSSISCTCSKRSWEPVPWQIRKVDTLGYSRIKLMNLHDYYGRVRRESEVLNHLKNELTKHET